MKKNSKYFWIILLSVIALICFSLWKGNRRFNCEEWEKAVLRSNISGLVTKKYHDRSDHGQKTIALSDGMLIDEVARSKHFWDTVEVGDSLIKRAGSMAYYVKKSDTTIEIVLSCHPEG